MRMKKAKSIHSFRFKLFGAFLIISFVVLGSLGVMIYQYISRIMYQQIIADEKNTMKQMATHVTYIQDTVEKTVKAIAISNEIQNTVRNRKDYTMFEWLSHKRDMRKILSTYYNIHPFYESVMVVDLDGNIFSSNNTEEEIEEQEWYQNWKKEGREKGYSEIHNYYIEQGQAFDKVISYLISFRNLENVQQKMGTIIINLNVNRLLDGVATGNSVGSSYCLYSGTGEVICGDSISQNYEQLLNTNKEEIIAEDGSVILVNRNITNDWLLTSVIPANYIETQLKPIRTLAFLVFLVVTVLYYIILYIVIRHFTKPIFILKDAAENVADGKLDTYVSVDSGDEFTVLGNAFNKMVANIKELLQKSVEYEKKNNEIEINRLILQINPHFIYNTLNCIVYLARLKQYKNIIAFTNAFVSLLQDTLRIDVNDIFTNIEQEIKNIKNYITIQEIRYPNMIHVVYDIPEDVLQYAIPNVLIQPFVENAIYHGLAVKPEGGMLTIRICKIASDLEIRVIDDGIGMERNIVDRILIENDEKNGFMRSIGISNVKERILHIYGEPYGISIESQPENGTEVIITIPCREYTKK